MDIIRNQLEQSGFIVIPTPGVFFGYDKGFSDKEFYSINFMNSITGFSPKNQHYYYITGGAQGRLGKILMDVFAEFISSQCENTVIYYTGRKGKDPTDFQEAFTNLNQQHCGVHCLTNELETKTHVAGDTHP